ncbi:MAG: hypothetical protein V7K35_01635 [Nostoc sp.]
MAVHAQNSAVHAQNSEVHAPNLDRISNLPSDVYDGLCLRLTLYI